MEHQKATAERGNRPPSLLASEAWRAAAGVWTQQVCLPDYSLSSSGAMPERGASADCIILGAASIQCPTGHGATTAAAAVSRCFFRGSDGAEGTVSRRVWPALESWKLGFFPFLLTPFLSEGIVELAAGTVSEKFRQNACWLLGVTALNSTGSDGAP